MLPSGTYGGESRKGEEAGCGGEGGGLGVGRRQGLRKVGSPEGVPEAG